MVSTLLKDPQALSSTLAAFGMLQPRAFGSLKMRRDLGLGLYYLWRRTVAQCNTFMMDSGCSLSSSLHPKVPINKMIRPTDEVIMIK